jgi:predicted dehydrogenase
LHVYLEKPLSVSIREGRYLADLVRQTGRVLQVGSQQRTMEVNRVACEFLRTGGLGRIHRVELPNYPGPLPLPNLPEEPLPAGLDWNLFCGPTPLRPHNSRLWVKDVFQWDGVLWRGWDLFRDYSGHLMTNWGAHSVDMVQLALGRDHTGPVAIQAHPATDLRTAWRTHWANKTPAPVDDQDRRFWPVTMTYADGLELRFEHGPDFIVFHGDKGRLRMRRNFFETDPPGLVPTRLDPHLVEAWTGAGHVARPHVQNWLEAMRGGGAVHAPVEAGHRTATICHLANLARDLARPLRWDPTTETFPDDPDANSHLDRPRRAGFELPV